MILSSNLIKNLILASIAPTHLSFDVQFVFIKYLLILFICLDFFSLPVSLCLFSEHITLIISLFFYLTWGVFMARINS